MADVAPEERSSFPSAKEQNIISEAVEPEEFGRVLAYSLKLLNKKSYSSAALQEKLLTQCNVTLACQVIQRLKEEQVLNDVQACLVLSRFFLEKKPHSPAQLLQKLQRRKFSYSCIQSAFTKLEQEYCKEGFSLSYFIEGKNIEDFTENRELWISVTLMAFYQCKQRNREAGTATLKSKLALQGYNNAVLQTIAQIFEQEIQL